VPQPAGRCCFTLPWLSPGCVEHVRVRNRIERDGTGDATLAALLGVIFDEICPQPEVGWEYGAASLLASCACLYPALKKLQRRLRMLPLAEEEGQGPALAAAAEQTDAGADDPRGDDLLEDERSSPPLMPAAQQAAAGWGGTACNWGGAGGRPRRYY